jgi:hypothetical protein
MCSPQSIHRGTKHWRSWYQGLGWNLPFHSQNHQDHASSQILCLLEKIYICHIGVNSIILKIINARHLACTHNCYIKGITSHILKVGKVKILLEIFGRHSRPRLRL